MASQLVDGAMVAAAQGRSFDDIVEDLLTIAQKAAPSPIWSAIASIDRHADVRALEEWTVQQLRAASPPEHLSGIWFGLYEIGAAEGEEPARAEAVIELSGGPGFPIDPDWLCKQDWYPGGHAPTPGLRSLLAIGYSGGHYELVSYAVVFAYATGMVLGFLDAVDPSLVLDGRDQLGIVAGFHDGDIAQLGVLTANGLDRSAVAWA